MKKVLLTCTLALLAFVAFAQQSNPPTNPDETSQAFFKALLEEDGTALRNLITSDFAIVSFDGSLVDGNTMAEAMNGGYISIEKGTVEGSNVRAYGDAAVVTGNWRAKGALQSNPFDTVVTFTCVCVRQGGAWKVASVQFTPIG